MIDFPETIHSLEQAISLAQEALRQHPERDLATARQAALRGENRPFPVITINHLSCTDDDFQPTDERQLPAVEIEDEVDAGLAREIIGMLEPLKMLNPISLCFGLGKGPGTLIECFGIPLDPECANTPAYTIPIDEVLATPFPDPKITGLMPAMQQRIALIKTKTPEAFKINLPDYQGPFNIAHSLVGNDAMLVPYMEPDKFHHLMDKITDFWIEAVSTLRAWIGNERLNEKVIRIAECSVNLVSRETYEEFILPYDLRIREAFGPIGIHTCSGPHVFHATYDHIPDMVYTEAGFIKTTAAGSTPVDEAMEAVKDRPIMLNIGQELHDDNHFETIKKHLDLYKQHNRLLFCYTAMNLRKKDRPYIRDLHQMLDDYWADAIGR